MCFSSSHRARLPLCAVSAACAAPLILLVRAATMPSVYSRLAPYLTPQWLLAVFGSYLAYRLLRSWSLSRAARSQLARHQQTKAALRQAEFALAQERMAETEEERKKLQDVITQSTAAALVQKMSNGESLDV